MKKILFIFISLFCLKYNYALSQDMKIKWEDKDGREFSIKVMSGEFEYGMVPGDTISYQFDRVSRVGNVTISYQFDRVSRVGNVTISYDIGGRVSRVGNLKVLYEFDRVKGTLGKVN